MKLEDKISKIESKYNIKVLIASPENDYLKLEDENGFQYEIKYLNISKFTKSTRSMTKDSYIKYYNNKYCLNTDYEAIEINDSNRKIKILNKSNNQVIWQDKYTFNLKTIKSLTTKEESKIDFIKNKFGNKYDYSKLKYEGSKEDITLICPIHGEFNISWNNVLYRNHEGCTKCSYITRKFGKKGFINNCLKKDNKGYLYFINMYNKNESFFKIGITSNLKERYRKLPYDINELLVIEGSPDLIYDLEKILHKKYASNLYIPSNKFNGRLECFKFESYKDTYNEILILSTNFLI